MITRTKRTGPEIDQTAIAFAARVQQLNDTQLKRISRKTFGIVTLWRLQNSAVRLLPFERELVEKALAELDAAKSAMTG